MSLQSDYARRLDAVVAALASLGYITTLIDGITPTRQWRLTVAGLSILENE